MINQPRPELHRVTMTGLVSLLLLALAALNATRVETTASYRMIGSLQPAF